MRVCERWLSTAEGMHIGRIVMVVRIAPLVLVILFRATTATTVGIQRAFSTLFLGPSLLSALEIHR